MIELTLTQTHSAFPHKFEGVDSQGIYWAVVLRFSRLEIGGGSSWVEAAANRTVRREISEVQLTEGELRAEFPQHELTIVNGTWRTFPVLV